MRERPIKEPGRGRDTFTFTIRDRTGTVVATVSGTLTEGNVQSERLARRGATSWRRARG